MKSYTNIEQSKKLAEILPIESADMWLSHIGISVYNKEVVPQLSSDYSHLNSFKIREDDTPCWSLAALLGVLPSGYEIVKNYHSLYFVESRDHGKSTNIFNNPVDACVAMIEKLNERKKL